MIKIKSLHLVNLRNAGHGQFNSEIVGIVQKFTPVALNIVTEFSDYELKFNNEKTAFKLIRKSASTEAIAGSDLKRDFTARGLQGHVKADQYHFTPAVKAAANRVIIVLDTYGDIEKMEYNEATMSYNEMIAELTANYAADITLMGLDGWLNELRANNQEFSLLMSGRFEEGAGKTTLRMKQVRVEVDEAYENMVEQVHALMRVNGAAAYEAFIREVNQVVDKYNDILARREGNGEDGSTGEGEVNEGGEGEITPQPLP